MKHRWKRIKQMGYTQTLAIINAILLATVLMWVNFNMTLVLLSGFALGACAHLTQRDNGASVVSLGFRFVEQLPRLALHAPHFVKQVVSKPFFPPLAYLRSPWGSASLWERGWHASGSFASTHGASPWPCSSTSSSSQW